MNSFPRLRKFFTQNVVIWVDLCGGSNKLSTMSNSNTPEYTALFNRCTIKPGDIVTCRPFTKGEMGFNEVECCYSNEITGKVVGIMDDYAGYFIVRVDTNGYCVPFFAITSITKSPEVSEESIKSEEFVKFHTTSGFNIGDCVRITHKAKTNEMGWGDQWFPIMNRLVGNTYTITSDGRERGWGIADNKIIWYVPDFILQKAEASPIYFDTSLGYKVSINKTASIVRVGEHKLTPSDLKSILSIMTDTEHDVHNPDELTPEEYGEKKGYRLLDEDEIKERRVAYIEIEKFCSDRKWRKLSGGNGPLSTYRTKLSREQLAKLI